MVKAYLRFEAHQSVGVVTSREANVAYDVTGRLALTGCVDAVGVWNLRQGQQERSLAVQGGSHRVTRLSVREARLDDKSVCAVGYMDGSVRLWDIKAASILQTLQGHRSAVSCLSFDKSGHRLASGSNDTDIVLWDVAAESGIARLTGHVDAVTSVLFWEAPDAPLRLISASKDRLIRIWSVEMQICVQAIADHRTEVWSLAMNAEQTRLVAGTGEKFLRVWALKPVEEEAATAKTAAESGEHSMAQFLGSLPRAEGQGQAVSLCFAAPPAVGFEVLLCQGSGRTVEVFRCFSAHQVARRRKRRERRRAVKKQKKAEQSGQVVEPEEEDEETKTTGQGDGTEEDHAADEFTHLQTHRCTAKALSMAWSEPQGSVLLGLTNNVLESLRISWVDNSEDPASASLQIESSLTLELCGHRTGVRALAVANDDSMFLSLSNESVKVWSASTGRCVRTIASGYGLCGFFLAGNEHVLIGTKEGQLELYNIQLGEQAQTMDAHSGAVYGLAVRPDNQGCVSCSADKTLRFFDIKFTKGSSSSVTLVEQPDRATELPDELLAVAFSANGKYINVALLNHTIVVLFEDSLKFYLSLYGHRLPVMALDVSDDSQMIASGSADKNVRLWSTQFGNCLKSLKAHEESVMQVKFLPGTHYLATAGRDHKLKLWDCDSYELITALPGHACEILAMALSQDAAFIVTAGSDKQIRIWRRTQEQLFLSEERAKELEEQFEQEVEREDLAPAAAVAAPRPTRRSVESVRTTERLMEVLDEAKSAQEQLESEGFDAELVASFGQGAKHPVARAVAYINTLNASNIYEVILALPFSHALLLLRVVARFFDAVAALPGGDGAALRAKALSAAATLETPCQAALIAAYVHHSEFAATSSARPLLLRLRLQMRNLLQAEKDRIGLSLAGFGHLQRTLKRTSREVLAGARPKPKALAKKRRK